MGRIAGLPSRTPWSHMERGESQTGRTSCKTAQEVEGESKGDLLDQGGPLLLNLIQEEKDTSGTHKTPEVHPIFSSATAHQHLNPQLRGLEREWTSMHGSPSPLGTHKLPLPCETSWNRKK